MSATVAAWREATPGATDFVRALRALLPIPHNARLDAAHQMQQSQRPVDASRRRSDARDACVVFLLAVILVWPLFKVKYTDNWPSIESTFIADGRYLKEHWPHPRWQPLWYCGTRFDYVYPPALRYGTAALAKFTPLLPVRAYHVYTAFFYAVGIAAVYLLVMAGTRSRRAAWLGAIAVAFLSPSFLFLPNIRGDAIHRWPQRLNALIRYGEGPHITAVSLLPLVLAAAWFGLRARRPAMLVLAAALSALVVSNNFYGATSLALFFPMLVWALWVTHQDHWIFARAAAIAVLAYGLTAFWLVPSYLRITLENMKYVSEPGNRWSVWVAIAAAALFAAVTWRLARHRPERAWITFVCGAVAVFGLNVLGDYYVHFRVLGVPERLVPELDLALILLGLEALRRLWRGSLPRRAMVVALVAASFLFSLPYLKRPWKLVTWDPRPQDRIEYRITEWMWRNMPQSRALVSGSVRFWYNAWFDLPQIGGGSEQGLMNELVTAAQWQLNLGEDPELGRLWLVALGADAAIVHDKNSTEIYHDTVHPQKFRGVLPVAYDNGLGDTIYRVPRRPGLARVVNSARALSLKRPAYDTDRENLAAYVELVEALPEPLMTWQGSDEMRIRARVEQGQSVVAMTTYDPSWRAYEGSHEFPIRRDAMNFLLIDTPPGERDIRLVFELPLENAVGRVITGCAVILIGGILFWSRRAA